MSGLSHPEMEVEWNGAFARISVYDFNPAIHKPWDAAKAKQEAERIIAEGMKGPKK